MKSSVFQVTALQIFSQQAAFYMINDYTWLKIRMENTDESFEMVIRKIESLEKRMLV